MKIIGGKLKGKNFYLPHGIRPSPNILRKAIFDIFGQDLRGVEFLELFAGSGSVGLEALSLGARRVTFVENDPWCVRVIEENIRFLGMDRDPRNFRYEIIHADAFHAIKQWAKTDRKFDLAFIDPPYASGLAKKALKLLSAYGILHPACFIIIQHEKREILPESSGRFLLIRQKNYGSSWLTVYEGQAGLSVGSNEA